MNLRTTFFSVLTVTALSLIPISGKAQVIGNTGGGKGWTMTGTNPIELRWGGELVTTYQTSEEFAKPYFYPLIGPTGENVTRHWPMKEGVAGEAQDHPHHRGLWYGLGSVNGYDFWHEPASGKKPKPFGKIIHKGMNGVSTKGDTTTIKVRSEWQGMEDHKKIMEDRRVFSFTKKEDGTLIIDARITLMATDGDVTINDDKEGAWAIRVIPTMRLKGEVAKGTMINSAGQVDGDVWGKKASWVDYSGPTADGRTIGIAIMDHPKNLRYPTWYHARDYGLFAANPFGQGNFEKDVEKGAGDYTIKNGESLTFNYRTILHPGDAKSAGLDEEFKKFAETAAE